MAGGDATAPASTRDTALRVAIVFGTFPPDRNGGADFVARFGPALAAQGADVHVLTSAEHTPEREGFAPGVTVHRIIEDWTFSHSGRRALARANDVLRTERTQIVHVIFPDSVLQEAYQVPAALGLGRVPLVATFWNIGLGRRSPWPIRAEAGALLARSALVTSHDPTYLRALRRIVGWWKPVRWLGIGSHVDASGVAEREAARARLGLDGVPSLAYFGHLDFTRGIEDLFEALARLRRERDVRLVMVGSAGDEQYAPYREIAARLGVGDALVWTGYLPDREAAAVLAAADLCVLPYRRNSLGRSALAAALDVGVPTVLGGTPAGVAPLRPGDHVALVPPDDPATLARTIGNLLDDEDRRRQLAAGARRASRLFAWPRTAACALGLYREVLRQRTRSKTA